MWGSDWSIHLFSQGGGHELQAGGGGMVDEMVGLLVHSSGHGRGYKMVVGSNGAGDEMGRWLGHCLARGEDTGWWWFVG